MDILFFVLRLEKYLRDRGYIVTCRDLISLPGLHCYIQEREEALLIITTTSNDRPCIDLESQKKESSD